MLLSIASNGVVFSTHNIGLARTADRIYSLRRADEYCEVRPWEKTGRLSESDFCRFFWGCSAASLLGELGMLANHHIYTRRPPWGTCNRPACSASPQSNSGNGSGPCGVSRPARPESRRRLQRNHHRLPRQVRTIFDPLSWRSRGRSIVGSSSLPWRRSLPWGTHYHQPASCSGHPGSRTPQ